MKRRSCIAALLAAMLFFVLPYSAHANVWNDWMSKAYSNDGYATGILPWGSEELVINKPTEFISCPHPADLDSQDIAGKIVLLGSADDQSYDDLITKAKEKKAVALLIGETDRNKRDSDYRSELSEANKPYPMMLLDEKQVAYLLPHAGKKLMTERPHEDPINTYSSWGLSSDFVFNPDLIAPGTVFAPFSRLNPDDPDAYPAFGVLEGTSMSTPTVAGAGALAKDYLTKMDPDLKGAALVRAVRTQLQNTAFAHRDKQLKLSTPRWQGAGNVDAGLATCNPLLISTPYSDTDVESGMGKVNLRDTIRPGGPSDGVINFSLNMKNLSDEPITLKTAEAVLLVDNVVDKRVAAGSKEVARVSLGKNITVAGKGTDKLPVKIDFRKYLDNEMTDIKEVSPNGFYVEGFVVCEYHNKALDKTVELSVPFIGFYGDWFAVPVIERSIYDRGPDDIPYYGPFSAIKQTGGGDFVTPFCKPYFAHFAGLKGSEDVVLGADWNFNLEDLKSVETEMIDGEEHYVGPRTPHNPSVRKDKIAVSVTGNGAHNIRLKSPAMRNWLVSRLELCDSSGNILLVDEHGLNGMREKHSKDHGQWAASSQGDVEDDNKIKRRTEFGSLDLSKVDSLPEGMYLIRVKVRPDAVNQHNPVALADAQARGFDTYWQTEEYPLIVDSTPPSNVTMKSKELDGEYSELMVTATDVMSGVKCYELLNAFSESIEKNQTGVFKVKTADLKSYKVNISDFAYNNITEEVAARLNMGDTGHLEVKTVCDDPAFNTSYYAVSKSNPANEYVDLNQLPVGEYDVYLLNPKAGYKPNKYHQDVTITKDQTSELTFEFTSAPELKYYLDLKTDLTFEMYEERLPGLKGSNYTLQMTDKTTHMRYLFPPSSNGLSEIHDFINHGDYEYAMPGLRAWKESDPDYSKDKKNWKLGIQDNDGYAYTSDVPKADRPKPFASLETKNLVGRVLEYYFYESRPDTAISTPILVPENPKRGYQLGTEKITFDLHQDRKQNPDQFRLLLPSRLADDPDIQNDPNESWLIDTYNHRAEINSYSEDYFSSEKMADTGRTRITITIPPIMRSKLQEGDKLIIQEMDNAWNPYPDNQVHLTVVKRNDTAALSHSDVRTHANESIQPADGNNDTNNDVLDNGNATSDSDQPVIIRPRVKERLNERIGHEQAWKNRHKGKGQLIAVIDNGIEFTHPSFQKAAPNPNDNKIANADALKERVAKAKSGPQADKVILEGRYINEKIPYAYNYYSHSSDQDSMLAGGSSGFEHGAHCAGIAAANPNYDGYPDNLPKFTGVAPEAQLAIMSVATSSGFTAESEALFAQAIYDAVALGADSISVSIGSGVGTTLNVDQNFCDAIAYAQSEGVVVNFATGNSGFFGYGLPPANGLVNRFLYDLNMRPYAENPDYGTMDAPAVYDGVNAVSAYGANIFPPLDSSLFNPAISEDSYSHPYWRAYLMPRLYVAPPEDVEEPQPVPTPDPIPQPTPDPGDTRPGDKDHGITTPIVPGIPGTIKPDNPAPHWPSPKIEVEPQDSSAYTTPDKPSSPSKMDKPNRPQTDHRHIKAKYYIPKTADENSSAICTALGIAMLLVGSGFYLLRRKGIKAG